jgi:hypothetical protein
MIPFGGAKHSGCALEFGGAKHSGCALEFGVDGLKAVAVPQVISG